MTVGIYLIKNVENQKCYIGSSVNVENRIKNHLYSFRSGGNFKAMQKEFDEYGENSFVFTIVEKVTNANTIKEREDFYIDKFNTKKNGYNIRGAAVKGWNNVGVCLNDDVFDMLQESCTNEGVVKNSWVKQAIIEKLERERV